MYFAGGEELHPGTQAKQQSDRMTLASGLLLVDSPDFAFGVSVIGDFLSVDVIGNTIVLNLDSTDLVAPLTCSYLALSILSLLLGLVGVVRRFDLCSQQSDRLGLVFVLASAGLYKHRLTTWLMDGADG